MEDPRPPTPAPAPAGVAPLSHAERRAVASLAYIAAALSEAMQAPDFSDALARGAVTGRVARETGLDLSSLARVRLTHALRLFDAPGDLPPSDPLSGLRPGPSWGDDDGDDDDGDDLPPPPSDPFAPGGPSVRMRPARPRRGGREAVSLSSLFVRGGRGAEVGR